ncbi:ExeA family protein [Oceanobacter sp. 3_MG-2023]|uniref:ExeA family protein n=1 Tax=Oceanobacter sp. 3_MG-2023 TaxID=3062622 RepID=UPI0027348E9F|nr:AAA family ATPase [Oceanobacter sp. 3_MG-2023]MDP2504237.1 AAA family ATPase [Oceanobacter sp. 3_MG-2023]
MYLDHFSLDRFPFTIAPDPAFLFPSAGHQEALAHLHYALTGHGGLICLTGDVGTGKTTLCRAFLEQTPDNIKTAYLFNPQLSQRELLQALCDELDITYAAEASQQALYQQLNHSLLAWYAEGKRVICVVDEAQAMPVPSLEQIRLLTNLETSDNKLLTLILVGQPELRDVLQRHELRQLNQRITARYHLKHLSQTETYAYLRHRLATAGCERQVFDEAAASIICRGCGGIPRLINSVADRALLGAYARGDNDVHAPVARQALVEVLGDTSQAAIPKVRTRRLPGAALAGALGVMIVLLIAIGLLVVEPSWRATLARWITPVGTADGTRDSAGNGNNSDKTLEAAPVLAKSVADPNAAESTVAPLPLIDNPPIDPRQAAAEHLSQAMGLEAGNCDQLQGRGWQCLWVAWPYSQLQPLQYQVAVSYDDQWQLLTDLESARIRPDRVLKALLIWQAPAGYHGLVRQGTSAEVVAWVRAQLGVEWHGDWQRIGPSGSDTQAAGPDKTFYDPLLGHAVARFQASQGLTADRIIGPQTLLYLQRRAYQAQQEAQ